MGDFHSLISDLRRNDARLSQRMPWFEIAAVRWRDMKDGNKFQEDQTNESKSENLSL